MKTKYIIIVGESNLYSYSMCYAYEYKDYKNEMSLGLGLYREAQRFDSVEEAHEFADKYNIMSYSILENYIKLLPKYIISK